MKQIILWILSCFILSGCAGLADYDIDLPGNYSLLRTSANQITIAPKTEIGWGPNVIPARVVAVWWNEQYIVAKQLHLKADQRGYEEPPQNPTDDDYSYWILEMDNNQVKGPLSVKELENESKKLGINIIFTPIEKLKSERS